MRYVVAVAFYCLLIAGCKKEDEPVVPAGPQMPAPTQTGANRLVCKVNGDIHVYKGKFSWNHPDGVSFGHYTAGNYTFIKANEDEKYNDNIDILIYQLDIEVGKEYILSGEGTEARGQYYPGEGTQGHVYVTEQKKGVVKFSRHDSLVAAGMFSYTAYNPAGEKVEITEGFFDISLKE